MSAGVRLGIDYGTSNTVAALRWPDGRTIPLLFDGSPLLPSAVFVTEQRAHLVGRDAAYSARAQPDRYEPAPKRCIDDGTVLVGADEVRVADLIASTLRRVRHEAETTAGTPIDEVVLAFPAAWGARRRAILRDAARRGGLPDPALVAEPVAAATFYAEHLDGRAIKTAPMFIVYDLGAGTFDASIVRRDSEAFEVIATGGLIDTGGLDIDAAVMAYLAASYAEQDPDRWARIEQPQDNAQRRDSRQLWDDIRAAKELLSRSSSTFIHLPGLNVEVPLGREQLDRLAAPLLRRTLTVTRGLLRDVGAVDAAAPPLVLVGGASRMPLVATMLHRMLDQAPLVVEHPELAVALGSVLVEAKMGVGNLSQPPSVPVAAPPEPVRAEPVVDQPVSAEPVVDQPVSAEPVVDQPANHEVAHDRGRSPRRDVSMARPGIAQPDGVGADAHLIRLTLPAFEGYSVRRYTDRSWNGSQWVNDKARFLTHDSKLLLFTELGALSAHLRDRRTVLGITRRWLDALDQTIDDGALVVDEDDRYDLDLAVYSAAGGPRLWAPEVLVPARNLAAELATDLEIDALHDLLAEGSVIDQLDDVLRASGVRSWLLRRKLNSLPPERVAKAWRRVVTAVERAVYLGDRPTAEGA